MSNRTRCKFVCRQVKPHLPSHPDQATIMLTAICDDDKQVAEDEAFTKYTPYGELIFSVSNPNVLPMFEVGKQYYIDISPVEEARTFGDDLSDAAKTAAKAEQVAVLDVGDGTLVDAGKPSDA